MIKIVERISDNEQLFEMTNIRPKMTGLPFCIWIKEKSDTEKHNARIKVSTKYRDKVNPEDGFFTITIPNKEIIGETGELKQKDIKLVLNWIDLNSDILVSLWNKDIDIGDFLSMMKTI